MLWLFFKEFKGNLLTYFNWDRSKKSKILQDTIYGISFVGEESFINGKSMAIWEKLSTLLMFSVTSDIWDVIGNRK